MTHENDADDARNAAARNVRHAACARFLVVGTYDKKKYLKRPLFSLMNGIVILVEKGPF